MALMGIDIGSTGCKCVVGALDGGTLAKRYRDYGRPAGATEFDGPAIWELVCGMVRECVREAGEPVEAVCVTSIGEAVAPVGRDGAPLHPFMQSTSDKGARRLPELREKIGDRVRAVTGLNPLQRYSLSKIAYLREERPALFRSAWKFMQLGDFIVYRLSGGATTDCSLATRTAMFNLDEKRFDPEILRALGVDPEKMCEVRSLGSVAGEVRDDVACSLGLPPGVAVVLGGHDTIPEQLSAGLLSTGVASVGCGTFEGVGVLVPETKGPVRAFLDNNFSREPYPAPGLEFVNGVNPNAGGLVQWFRDEFGQPECRAAAGGNPFRLLDELVPDEPSGLLTVPHFCGSGAPEFAAHSRGVTAGFRPTTTRGHVYRSILEGVAYEMAFIVEKYRECGVDIREVLATSGGAKSPVWLRIRADILGIPVVPALTADTTVAGCVMLAGVALGRYPGLAEAAAVFVRRGEPVVPDPAAHAVYRELFRKYRALRNAMLDFWASV